MKMIRGVLGAAAVAVGVVALAPSASAAGNGVSLDAAVDGASLASAQGAHPVRLDPSRPAMISLRVDNPGRSPIEVRTVSFSGEVMGLSFFRFDTAVSLTVPPGQTGTLRFPLDLAALSGEATGFMPASMTILDRAHNPLAGEATVVDVRGSVRSVYGLFGMATAVLTAALLVSLLLALARHRLPDNRWRRALRFLPLGVGTALVAIFTLSAARIVVPTAGHWLPILVGSVAVAFALGYLSPAPGAAPEPEEDQEEEDDEEEPEQTELVETVLVGSATQSRTTLFMGGRWP